MMLPISYSISALGENYHVRDMTVIGCYLIFPSQQPISTNRLAEENIRHGGRLVRKALNINYWIRAVCRMAQCLLEISNSSLQNQRFSQAWRVIEFVNSTNWELYSKVSVNDSRVWCNWCSYERITHTDSLTDAFRLVITIHKYQIEYIEITNWKWAKSDDNRNSEALV